MICFCYRNIGFYVVDGMPRLAKIRTIQVVQICSYIHISIRVPVKESSQFALLISANLIIACIFILRAFYTCQFLIIAVFKSWSFFPRPLTITQM